MLGCSSREEGSIAIIEQAAAAERAGEYGRAINLLSGIDSTVTFDDAVARRVCVLRLVALAGTAPRGDLGLAQPDQLIAAARQALAQRPDIIGVDEFGRMAVAYLVADGAPDDLEPLVALVFGGSPAAAAHATSALADLGRSMGRLSRAEEIVRRRQFWDLLRGLPYNGHGPSSSSIASAGASQP
jgi:hypothetical protein